MADLTTPLCRLLGIEVPIVQALIGTLAAPELAAVSQLLVGPRSELGEGLAMCLRSTARPVPIIMIWAARSGGNRHARAVQNGYRAPYLGSAATVRDASRGSREPPGAAMASISAPT